MHNQPRVSLQSIAYNINKDWSLEDWLQWPPDAFALLSIIINRTGLYKYFLLDTDWWQKKSWTVEIDELSDTWIKVVSNRLRDLDYKIVFEDKDLLKPHFEILLKEFKDPTIEIDHLRVLGNIYDDKRKTHRDFIKAVLYFAVVADVTCGGLGILGQSLGPQNLSHRIFMGVANLLLNNTGTLSTISKHHGVVLPKMRTPQGGMTVRSMTHHLTFHITEVEVMWRTFPLLVKDNDLNILAVPYPYEIKDSDFIANSDDNQIVRYFQPLIDGKPANHSFIRSMVDWVGRTAMAEREIDIIVLPEMALTFEEYEELLNELKTEFLEKKRGKRLPIIVTGITKGNTNGYGIISVDKPYQNEARIAVFFAGRWYTTTQRKHHRWQLDGGQIDQYELGTPFKSDKLWFEYCTASQRRMTIMAPNSQLTLTALICEDLAQQEPVSEIIRGIGPSLLLALLSDGPQLTSRWSARYAGVLANDPGTAVLSLTSLGMSLRSKNLSDKSALPIRQPGLWKDMKGNTIDLTFKEKGPHAFLFTITSSIKEEHTFDGRSDGTMSSYLHWIDKDKKAEEITFRNIKGSLFIKKDRDELRFKNSFESLRELSALQFAIDSIIEILIDKSVSRSASTYALKLFIDLLSGAKRFSSPKRKFRGQIFLNMKNAWDDPQLLGISATAPADFNASMKKATDDLQVVIDSVNKSASIDVFKVYATIINECKQQLKSRAALDDDKRTFMSILYNIHNRLIAKNNEGELYMIKIGLSNIQIENLLQKIKVIVDITLFES